MTETNTTTKPASGAPAKKPDGRINIQIRRLNSEAGEPAYLGSATVSENFLDPLQGLLQSFKRIDREQRRQNKLARRRMRRAG